MKIWTDGGCRGNGDADALGAWAFVAEDGHEEFGAVENTTNNRTELQAIINAIRYAVGNRHQAVTIYTDSQLCINCATGKWRQKKNTDLWRDYALTKRGVSVSFVWVRGHSGDPRNERCDRLCCDAMDDFMSASADADALRHLRSIQSEAA